jgi:hypothetical protein
MVENKKTTFKYFKILHMGELIGITVDSINEKGEQHSSPLYPVSSILYDIMDWKEITLDEFQYIAYRFNLLPAPQPPQPDII